MKSIFKKFLFYLAKKILKRYDPEIVAITGSYGKTSAKEIASQVLKTKFKLRENLNSYNTPLGIVLTIIGREESPNGSFWGWFFVFIKALRLVICKRDVDYPEILILEMAANKPGDIKKLLTIVNPSISVITGVGETHLEFFKTIKKVVHEKRQIILNLEKTGYAILNRDEEDVYETRTKTEADVISFGYHPEADIRVSDVSFKLNSSNGYPEGLICKINYRGTVVPIYLPGVIGEHIIYPALAAIGISLSFGMHMVEISQALQSVTMPPGRMRILPGIKNTVLIDDTYNASPGPMRSALHTLANFPLYEAGERYAVLGDMLELGQTTENAHKEVGKKVMEHEINFFITIGEAMKSAVMMAKNLGFDEHRIASFDRVEEAGKFLQEKMQSNDVILIKGSRAMHMEKIVKEVMAEPEKANSLLVN